MRIFPYSRTASTSDLDRRIRWVLADRARDAHGWCLSASSDQVWQRIVDQAAGLTGAKRPRKARR